MALPSIPLCHNTGKNTFIQRPSQIRRGSGLQCGLCGKLDCNLSTHKAYLARLRGQGFRNHDVSKLLSTSFASSYNFNPLSIAINYVCEKLDFEFDLNSLGDHASLTSALNKLISYDIGRNVPFTDPAGSTMGEVAAEWLVAASVDEISCASTLNLWMLIEWTNTKKPILERYISKLTTLFLELLRKRVECEEPVSVGTIFAASNHLATCLIFFEQTNSQREVMMNGLEALVNARGGFERLTDKCHPGLFQSLLWSDVLYSCFTGSRPRFHVRVPPPMPHSLIPERTATSTVPALYQNCCGPDLLDTARYLKLFLLFRHGAELRALSKAEYQYLVALERFVHVQLLDQSARYHNTGTITECIVLAMGLLRMSVLCIWEQHVMARRMYAQRLDRALQKVSIETWLEANAACALIWVCWVLLAQEETEYNQNDVVDLMTSTLKYVYGPNTRDWPDEWETSFANTLEPLLWHSDYDSYALFIGKLISDHALNEE